MEITRSASQSNLNSLEKNSGHINQNKALLEDRAHLFCRTVVGSLLQNNTKVWAPLKKKIVDLILDYE